MSEAGRGPSRRRLGAARLDLCDFGVLFSFTWYTLMNFYDGFQLGWPTPGASWSLNYLALSIGSLAVLALSFRRPARGASFAGGPAGIIDWASMLAMVAAAVLVRLAPPPSAGVSALRLACILCGGLALAWNYCRWVVRLSQLSLERSVEVLAAASVAWPVLSFLVRLLPAAAGAALTGALPVLSFLCLRASGLRRAAADEEAGYACYSFDEAQPLVKTLLVVGVVSACISAAFAPAAQLWWASEGARRVATPLATAAYGLVLYLWAERTSLDFSFVRYWRITLSVVACTLVMGVLAPGATVLAVVVDAAWNILVPTVWLTACDIARRMSRVGPMATAAACFCVYGLGCWAGTLAYAGIASLGGSAGALAVMLLALFFVMGFVLESRDPQLFHMFEELRGRNVPPDDYERIDAACESLGRRFGLTARELDTIRLVSEGKSRTAISEALCVSENTVKSHVGHTLTPSWACTARRSCCACSGSPSGERGPARLGPGSTLRHARSRCDGVLRRTARISCSNAFASPAARASCKAAVRPTDASASLRARLAISMR